MSPQALEMHWKSSAEAKQQHAFTEDASSVADGGLALTMMSLPVWVDIPIHTETTAAPADQLRATPSAEEGCQSWEDSLMVCGDSQQSPSQSSTDATSGILETLLSQSFCCLTLHQ